MTDRAMTETVAVKVMGVTRHVFPKDSFGDGDHNHNFYQMGSTIEGVRVFDPLTSDADCMAAWDRFADQHHNDVDLRFVSPAKEWQAGFWHYAGLVYSYNTDRRRAMVECMCKAVAK